MSVFARRIEEMLQLRPEQVWTVRRTRTRNITAPVSTHKLNDFQIKMYYLQETLAGCSVNLHTTSLIIKTLINFLNLRTPCNTNKKSGHWSVTSFHLSSYTQIALKGFTKCKDINLLVSLCSSRKRYIATAFITAQQTNKVLTVYHYWHARTHTHTYTHKVRINLSFSLSKKSLLATNLSPNSYFIYGARSRGGGGMGGANAATCREKSLKIRLRQLTKTASQSVQFTFHADTMNYKKLIVVRIFCQTYFVY